MGALLEGAIDDLYRMFEHYPRPPWFIGCGCCWDGEAVVPDGASGRHASHGSVRVAAPGADAPLRTLSAEELSSIAFEVPLTGGSLEVQQHYLPRILEIAVTDGFGWPDLEVVFARLNVEPEYRSTPWTEWPEPEQVALRSLFHALWTERLSAPVEDDTVDSALCAIGLIEPEIEWYLATWLEFASPYAAGHLASFLQRNARFVGRGRLSNSFWADREPAPTNVRKIIEWAGSEPTRASVAAAADRARSADEREALEEIYLRWLP